MLKDYTTIKKVVWYLTPRKWRQGGAHFLRDVDKSLGRYIRGQIFVCVLIGSLSATLFWIFNMKYPLLLGLIIGITNVIPYFGPVIGAIPAVIIASALSVKMIIITVCIVFVMQFLEGNILSPLIVGKSLAYAPTRHYGSAATRWRNGRDFRFDSICSYFSHLKSWFGSY